MKNIVFDFGQVLIHFEPSYMVGKYVSDPDDAKLLEEVVFDRLYWDPMDIDAISDAEVVRLAKERLPERLWDITDTIYYNWIYNLPEMEGMSELIGYLKDERGCKLFLLSNISAYFAEHYKEIPILERMDKCIFSGVCKLQKPDEAIYRHLCSECGIIPEETVFIDDRKENIEAAARIGIKGYLFDGDAAKLRNYLDELLNTTV